MAFTLLLGGARSGKSSMAVRLALQSGRPVTFIATGEAGDEEMTARITRHRAERPAGWATVEEPLDLMEAVRAAPPSDFIVIDCLTLWVTNLCLRSVAEADAVAAASCVAECLAGREVEAVVVSNEVGLGIVPTNDIARRFRDTLGAVNSIFSARAERALLLVAGRSLELLSPGNALS